VYLSHVLPASKTLKFRCQMICVRPGAAEVKAAAVGLGSGFGDNGIGKTGEMVVRLRAFPRSLEAALVAALERGGGVGLHPTKFTHTVNVMQWVGTGDDDEGDGGGAGGGGGEVGPGRCCSSHHRMPCNSIHEGLQ